MNQRCLFAALVGAAISLGATAQSRRHSVPVYTPFPRTSMVGTAVDSNRRFEITIETHTVADAPWSSQQWRDVSDISSDAFPVYIWRSRSMTLCNAQTLWAPAVPSATMSFRIDPTYFRSGDTLWLEYRPHYDAVLRIYDTVSGEIVGETRFAPTAGLVVNARIFNPQFRVPLSCE